MGEESSEGHGSFLMDSQGNEQGTHLILFSLKRIALPRAEISRLRVASAASIVAAKTARFG